MLKSTVFIGLTSANSPHEPRRLHKSSGSSFTSLSRCPSPVYCRLLSLLAPHCPVRSWSVSLYRTYGNCTRALSDQRQRSCPRAPARSPPNESATTVREMDASAVRRSEEVKDGMTDWYRLFATPPNRVLPVPSKCVDSELNLEEKLL